MYTVILAKKLDKNIAKFSSVEQARVYKHLKELELNPRPQGKKIKAFQGIAHGLRLRIGDIRVIYTVNDKSKNVIVIDIGRRGHIY